MRKNYQEKMTKIEKQEIQQLIKTQIEDLKLQIYALEEKTKPIAPDCSLGRLTRLEAMGESLVSQKILDKSRVRLVRLKNALSRVDNQKFGICTECEEAIPIERMRVRPESIRCVECESS